jgi:hypothetical protein
LNKLIFLFLKIFLGNVVHIRNLSLDSREKHLKELLEKKFGRVREIEIIRERATG